VVHGEFFSHPTQLLRDAQNSLEDFQRIHSGNRDDLQTSREIVEAKWEPPPENMLKMNWDAGINKTGGLVGIGLIVRDFRDSCLAAQSLSLEAHTKAATAEALAAVHAIMFCKELGLSNIILEGDALQVITAIGEEGPCFNSFGHLIECIHHEQCELERVRFIHVRREANNAAHLLAQLATTHVTLSTWLGNAPPSVGDIVRREQSLLLV
jgi:ribonuclease HI